jgi:hypothetical protein
VWVWWLAGGVLAAVVGVALLVVGRRRVTDGE